MYYISAEEIAEEKEKNSCTRQQAIENLAYWATATEDDPCGGVIAFEFATDYEIWEAQN